MKASRLFMLIAAMAIIVLSVPANATIEIVDNRSAAETASFSEADFETTDYLYVGDYGSSGFVVIKNNSEANITANVEATAYNASENILGTKSTAVDVIGPGETSIAEINFYDIEDPIDHFDYEVTYEKSRYLGALSDLSVEAAVNDSNVILTVTNTGDKSVQYLQGYVLFMDADNSIIRYDYNYITDDDGELKAGATLSSQFDSYDSFDHVECYLCGRSDGSTSQIVQSEVSDEDFDINEYIYDTGYGSIIDFLIVTNNSDKNVSISGNATAIGSTGNVIGAGDCDIDILAPGETSIGYFYFSDIGNDFDHSEYQLFYNTKSNYSPVISDLSAQASVNDKNVVMTVTNNGSEAARFVQAFVLFMDADNNVVAEADRYVTDDDSEIKPGATISVQLDAYKTFDHIEAYFTGRR